jgi:UPF0755 protein
LQKTLKFFTWIIILAIALGGSGYFWLNHVYLPQQIEIPNQLIESVDFEIKSGEGISSISNRLEEIGVVNSAWVLEKYLERNDLDSKVEAGFFHFASGLNTLETAEKLQHGGVKQISLTILEGWNSYEIDKKLTELGLIEENDFALFVREGGGEAGNQPDDLFADRGVASLEGYIFPATYLINPNNFSVENLVERMLNAMKENLATAGYVAENSTHSLHEILTVASLIELEERSEANRGKVSDIIWRRLDEGWQLGIDATLFYITGHKENLNSDDLAINSPSSKFSSSLAASFANNAM